MSAGVQGGGPRDGRVRRGEVRHGRVAEVGLQPGAEFGGRADRAVGVVEEGREEGVGVGGRQAGRAVAGVAEAGGSQGGFHRLAERGVVVRVDRVDGDAHQRRSDETVVGERRLERGGVEGGQAVPQGDVRGGRVLGLEGHDASYRLLHLQPLA